MNKYTENDMKKIAEFCDSKNIRVDKFLELSEYYDDIEDIKEYYRFMYYNRDDATDDMSEEEMNPPYIDKASFTQICNCFVNNNHNNYVLLLDNDRALICLYADQVF